MKIFWPILLAAGFMAGPLCAQTRTLRIVAYNIEADIGVTNIQPTFSNIVTSAAEGPPLPGLIAPPTASNDFAAGGVLEGIGEELVNGNAQPLDILALEETTSNPATVTPIVDGLNTFYGAAGMYSNSTYQATESSGDNSFGNGPNAIVFNTRTVQLLASVPVDPPGGTNNLGGVSSGYSGEYREVMRYQFAPAGVATNAANTFYILCEPLQIRLQQHGEQHQFPRGGSVHCPQQHDDDAAGGSADSARRRFQHRRSEREDVCHAHRARNQPVD